MSDQSEARKLATAHFSNMPHIAWLCRLIAKFPAGKVQGVSKITVTIWANTIILELEDTAKQIMSKTWLIWFVSLTIFNMNSTFFLLYKFPMNINSSISYFLCTLSRWWSCDQGAQVTVSLIPAWLLLSLPRPGILNLILCNQQQSELSTIPHSLGQSSVLNPINISINGPRYFWDSEYCTLFFVQQSERWCSSGLLFPFCSAFIS